MEQILQFFPKGKTPRSIQSIILAEAISALKDPSVDNVVIEAPVGTGKSAIALTLSNVFGGAHILTPQKRLQTQYEEDFEGELVGMRGRNFYPCEVDDRLSTADCPLRPLPNSTKAEKLEYKECVETTCPYTKALETAQQHNTVVHNYHSFIFQASWYGRFVQRPLIIFDEAHDLPGIVRDFMTYKRRIPQGALPKNRLPEDYDGVTMDIESLLTLEMEVLKNSEGFLTEKETEAAIRRIEQLESRKEYLTPDNVVMHCVYSPEERTLNIDMVPVNVGPSCNNLLYSFGQKRVFMSGTIFDVGQYCLATGLQRNRTKFIQSGTSFRKENRPIYLKPAYQVDTSFRNWDNNFEEMVEKLRLILSKFPDAKGLIHAPSYTATRQIVAALADTKRLVSHTSDNIEKALADFYSSKEPLVFISPSCYQGVDMKYDRARFQVVIRVPYPSTADFFIEDRMRRDPAWYNYQALVVFGQQLGRVVRAEDDFGATILLDSRFHRFLAQNRRYIPKWLAESFITG